MADAAQDVDKVIIDCGAFFNEEGKHSSLTEFKRRILKNIFNS